jgi:hypothetical protein
MISDHYDGKFDEWKKIINPNPTIPPMGPGVGLGGIPYISRTEFDNLKRQVEEMKELLTKALAYDRMTNQAECSNEEKLDRLEKIAKFAGIDCADLFKELRGIHAKKKRVVRKRKK